MAKLIFTSYGLTVKRGFKLILKELKSIPKENKKIFLVTLPEHNIAKYLRQACLELGFGDENIVLSTDEITDIENLSFDIVYITGGNTFRVLDYIRNQNLVNPIRKWMQEEEAIYIGASAGAVVAGVDIEIAKDFDRNFVGLEELTGLQLFDGTIIPHYTKKEVKRYISNCSGIEKKYKTILSVANERSLVLEK